MPPVATVPPAGTTPSIAPSGASKLAPKSNANLVKTVVIIFLSLLLVGSLFLAYYFYNEYKVASTDIDAQVAAVVLSREKEITNKLEDEFAEREKTPYRTFGGPTDYGALSFKYPKTWSAYIAKDASNGGNFEAILHPDQVVSGSEPYALHVTIESTPFESVANRYNGDVSKGNLTSSVISINGTDANRYDGTVSRDLVGSILILKIRDKTVTLQTDAEIYREDFNNIIKTITFNQ